MAGFPPLKQEGTLFKDNHVERTMFQEEQREQLVAFHDLLAAPQVKKEKKLVSRLIKHMARKY